MAANHSLTTTLTPTRETLSSSQLLSASMSSLSTSTSSSSSRQASSQISKIYRQSSTLFLTRRLPEALSTILPVITPPNPEDTHLNGETGPGPAPISKASRTTRIKVWSLYLTILNAVVELDPDEGKLSFGSSDWRALVTKVRDGQVWEEVVQNGYGGIEGDVDSDVVINLATLLLAHARSQKVNQQRLENYLAASTSPNLDISSRLQPSSRRHSRSASPNKNAGTDTPRDLNARVKILELYTLHVLLRNNEWDYSREFISMSPVLDEERREAFLQALQSLQDEQYEAERREKEEVRYQEEQLKKDIEDARRRRVEHEEREREREEEEQRQKRGGSEVDYGVEESRPGTIHSRKSSSAKGGSTKGSNGHARRPPTGGLSSAARSTAPPSAPRKLPPTIISRATAIFANLRKLVSEGMLGNFDTSPLFLLKILVFIVGLLAVLGRKEVKERLKRMMSNAWTKVRQTAGMGVKVSYI